MTVATKSSTPSATEIAKLKDLENRIKTLVPGTQVLEIPFDDIYVNLDENVRNQASYDDEELNELADSIEGVGGLLQPIGVTELNPTEATENKPFGLIYGFRRMMAISKIRERSPEDPRWHTVRAMIFSIDSAAAYKIVQMAENGNRKDLNAIETANGLKQIMDADPCMTQKSAAKILGLAESSASQFIKLLSLPQSVQDDVSSGKISFSHARIIAFDVPELYWADAATSAKSLTYDAFRKKMSALYGKSPDPKAAEEADKGVKGGTKPAKMIRSSVLETRYLPFLKEKLKKASTDKVLSEKDLIAAQIQVVEATLLTEGNALSAEIKPYLEKADKAEEAAKEGEEVAKKESKFLHKQVARVIEILRELPDPTDVNAKRTTPIEAYGMVAKSVQAMTEEQVKELGFPLDTKAPDFVKTFSDKVYKAYVADAEDKKKRKLEKAKKDAEAKKKEEETKAADAPATA